MEIFVSLLETKALKKTEASGISKSLHTEKYWIKCWSLNHHNQFKLSRVHVAIFYIEKEIALESTYQIHKYCFNTSEEQLI